MLTTLALVLSSCSKTTNFENNSGINDAYSAAESFSQILSKATHENQDLRLFIKSKALEQFDKDYDVFYPFVKDSEISQGKTFREILLQYTDEKTLCNIENAIPKLTILVPDWSWLHCFSINDWDASKQELAVTCISRHGDISCYSNGDYVGALPSGGFPDFPTLIIKSNERMTYTPPTKGGDAQYGCVNEYFDNSNNAETKVEHQYLQVTVDGIPDISNFVPESETHCKAFSMFHCFHGEGRMCYQRDYLYYGMTKEGEEKTRLENVWEYIHKFKFKTWNMEALHDDIGESVVNDEIRSVNYDFDYSRFNQVIDYKEDYGEKSAEQLRNIFYAEGNIELMFLVAVPSKNGTIFTTEKPVSLSFGDAFAIDYVDLDYRHRTWFCKDWYVYTLNKNAAIHPKWYYADIQLPRWDLSTDSGAITIVVTEIDEKGSSEIEYTVKSTSANNFKVDGEVSGSYSGASAKVGLGYNNSNTQERTINATYKREQCGIDKLGQAEVEYLHPILENRISKNKVMGYNVHVVSTGMVDIMMLPVSY